MTDEKLARLLLLSTRYDEAVRWAAVAEAEHTMIQTPASREAWVKANARLVLARSTVLDYIRELVRDVQPAPAHSAAPPDGNDK